MANYEVYMISFKRIGEQSYNPVRVSGRGADKLTAEQEQVLRKFLDGNKTPDDGSDLV
jgi:hypothetical protein